MPDWRAIVQQKLGKLGSDSAIREEIVSELAGYLEDAYEDHRAQGRSETEAIGRALGELIKGRRLGRKIGSAKEGDMNDRTRKFWLPGLTSLSAASVFLMVFARVSYMPHMLVVRSGVALMMYPAWLVAQPLFGGIGAYFSRRAGGSRLTRIFAALSPSIALLVLIFIGAIVQLLMASMGRPSDVGSMGTAAFARAIFFAIVVPSLALLLGALPFWRNSAKEA